MQLTLILMTNDTQDSFKTIPLSLLRVLIMMLGEIQFEEFLPHFFNTTTTAPNCISGSSSCIISNQFAIPEEVGVVLAIFSILMPIILMNLLVNFIIFCTIN